MNEELENAQFALAHASDDLRAALHRANAIEALVLLPLIQQVAETRNTLAALIAARDAAPLAVSPEMRDLLTRAAEVVADMRGNDDPKTPIESEIERTLASLHQ